MQIPADVIIPAEKLSQYLLLPKEFDDKSKFLAKAGFNQSNPELLMAALREFASQYEAEVDRLNDYGTFLRADGDLIGLAGKRLAVTVIWMREHLDGKVRFITLKPRKEPRR